jgi:branched-subunit amino acid ABC-type transport system permease component
VSLSRVPARLVACLLVLLALAGCARVDPEQARLCRMALPALYSEGTAIEVSATAGDGAGAVTVTHATIRPGRVPRETELACRFAGGRFSAGRRELVGVTLAGRPLPEANLLFLKRFWLADPAAARAAPPLSPAELAGVPAVPERLAVLLQHLLVALPQIAVLMLLAPAYALVYALAGRINLAFGDLAVLGGYGATLGLIGAASVLGDAPVALLPAAVIAALAVAATHGEAIGRLSVLPLARSGGQAFLVATIGLAVLLLEYLNLATGAAPRWTPPLLDAPLVVARAGDFHVSVTEMALLAAGIGMAGVAVLALAMRSARFGLRWRAVADDPLAAALSGVDPARVLLSATVAAALLAGLAGALSTLQYGGSGIGGGLALGLKALTAAVIGGIGSWPGAILGGLLLGAAEALWSATMPIALRDVAIHAALVVFLALRPGGLLGHADGAPRRV